MKELHRNILHCIGNTSLLALRNIVPENGSRILLKLENENPTGSMKDRMALAMIEAAEADERLRADGSVVEYTGGSTGVSPVSSLRGEAISPAHRDFGCLRPRKTRSYENSWGQASNRAKRERGHDGEINPGHDRSRPHHRGKTWKLLDGSAK